MGLEGSLKSLEAPLEDVIGLEVFDEVAVESSALTAAEAEGSAVEASSSLSVSTKFNGFLMAGTASRNLKGSWSDPLPKNRVSKFHNSLQSVPAMAINKC